MSASYSMFKTHCGASGIQHSTTGNFTSPTDTNLIVAKNNTLSIYKLPDKTLTDTTKLILVAHHTLFGEIQHLCCARFVPNHTDSLLLTFPDAKLSIIDFDQSTRNITTAALFNFDPLYRRIGNITASHDLHIRVDPLQRCAAIRISQDLLFILPLFVSYLHTHKQRKGSNPINVIFHDTLANEQQTEIEEEEHRHAPDTHPERLQSHSRNHNGYHRRDRNRHNRHGMPALPPPHDPRVHNGEREHSETEEEDMEYIQSMKSGDSAFDDESEWDMAYKKATQYKYKSLCPKHYFIINLRAKCQNIVDFIFLDGYNTPQILLLFEKNQTWGGRVPVRNKTISLLSLTVNVVRKCYNIPFILADILSYDFNRLYPIHSNSNMLHSSIILEKVENNRNKYVQTSIGGAFLIGANAILHFGQNIDFGLSLNEHGDILSKDFVLLRKWTERVINLEHCSICALDDKENSDFLLSDGDGFMYLLSIHNGKMNMCTFGNGPIPSTMLNLRNETHKFVFIGSRLGDSLLLTHSIRAPKPKKTDKSENKKQEISELKDQLFGDTDMETVANENGNKNRKRTFSQMDSNNDDLAMNLFGITTETLAAAAENNIDPKSGSVALDKDIMHSMSHSQSNTPFAAAGDNDNVLMHKSLYGPKVKRRKLSNKTELQIHDLHFMNVCEFEEDRLFEIEIEKEQQSRPKSNFNDENDGKIAEHIESEHMLAEYRRIEQILRKKYVFKIQDKIQNLSPITSVVMSKSFDPRFLHSDYINLMASTGFGTQAKLSIVQEGIRPQILAKSNSDMIISAVNCWTLFKGGNMDGFHNYLIATDLECTQVINVSDRVTVNGTDSEFKTDVRTILCAHIGKGCVYTAQVYGKGVRILRGLKMVTELKLEIEIIDACICDCYVLVHLQDKTVRLLTFESEKCVLDMKEVNMDALGRYKEITDVEKERRKKEFVARRCNRMSWEQYAELEKCIAGFVAAIDSESESEALVQYIDEILVNPPLKDGEMREEKKTNSMKEELSDSDGDVRIELADDLKRQISTGWNDRDWRMPKKATKTLFNLNLSIDIILKRLYGTALQDLLDGNTSINDILCEQISHDLDSGQIIKCCMYQYNGIKCNTLSALNLKWEKRLKQLSVSNADCYQQLLSSAFQTKRLDIKGLKHKGIGDSEQKLLSGLFFGEDTVVEEKEQNTQGLPSDNKETDSEVSVLQTFAVLVRQSGVLQIFEIPSFTLVYECSEIHIGHDLLCNNIIHDETLQIILSKHQLTKRRQVLDHIAVEIGKKEEKEEMYFENELIPQNLTDELWCSSTNIDDDMQYEFEHRTVDEMYVSTVNSHPYLLIILSNGDLLLYQMFEYFVGGPKLKGKVGRDMDSHKESRVLPLRLSRFKHQMFTRKQFMISDAKYKEINRIKQKIYPISDINGLKGVLVAVSGNTPVIILSHRGCPIMHNFSINDDIRGFAMFTHQNISKVAQDEKVKNGCIYFNEYGLVIATIPKSMHNIAYNSNTTDNIFKDIVDIENDQKELTETEEKIKPNTQKEEMDIDKSDEKKTENTEVSDNGTENDTDDNDPSMEIFGHSLVLMKQRMNNLLPYVDIDYNFEYPVCHIPLSETLHFIVKHPQSGTYLLIMSRYKYIAGTEMLQSRDIKPIEAYFECRLLNPYKWRFDDRLSGFTIHQSTDITVGGAKEDCEENSIPISEHILCAKSVMIQESSRIGSQTTVNKNLIVLGTGTNQGEDNASIGRIVMLEIIAEKDNKNFGNEIVAPNIMNKHEKDERFYARTKENSDCNLLSTEIREMSLENEELTEMYQFKFNDAQKRYIKRELKYYKMCMEQDKINNIRYRIHYVFARRERAAVTAINCVNGLIVAAIGPKLLLFRWDGTQLIGCAFLDTRIHCHNILVMKNFVLTADLFQGLDLYHWEQDIASMVKLARDVQYRSVYSINWRVHSHMNSNTNAFENEFEFIVSDMNQNLHIIAYQPHLFGRFGFLNKMDKEKLYTKCLFHIGTNISDSIVMRFRDQNQTQMKNGNYFNLNVCIDGSVNYLIPISEQIYRRLSSLHSQMIFYCKHNCGLNPREYRYCMNNCMSNRDNSGRTSHIMYNHSQLNAIHGCDRSAPLTSKNVIDHDLVKQFVNLDYRTQNKLTTNIGVKNANVIINHLKQLYNNTKWF